MIGELGMQAATVFEICLGPPHDAKSKQKKITLWTPALPRRE
jgi:hypothetical protein